MGSKCDGRMLGQYQLVVRRFRRSGVVRLVQPFLWLACAMYLARFWARGSLAGRV